MDTVTLRNNDNAVEIALFGGHILRWLHQGRSVLWLSELADLSGASAIRGGIPICFPWFAEQGTPKHGFARTQTWRLQQQTDDSAILVLSDNPTTFAIWPHRFELTLTVQVKQNQLNVALDIANTDTHPWSFGGALHSYFACADARKVTVNGLTQLPFINSLQQSETQQFWSSTLPNPIDAIVPELDHIQANLGYRIELQHNGSDSCVVWNPAELHPSDVSDNQRYQFICFEAAIALKPVALAPSQRHRLTQTILL